MRPRNPSRNFSRLAPPIYQNKSPLTAEVRGLLHQTNFPCLTTIRRMSSVQHSYGTGTNICPQVTWFVYVAASAENASALYIGGAAANPSETLAARPHDPADRLCPAGPEIGLYVSAWCHPKWRCNSKAQWIGAECQRDVQSVADYRDDCPRLC